MIPPIFVPSARDVSARLVAILAAVTSIIFARTHIFAALGPPLHNRIVAASRRLAAILAHLAAGTFRPHPSKPGKKGGPPPIYIPHRRAWLVEKLGYHMAAYTSHLEHLLRAPETQTLLATAPPEALKSLGRTLRPIARLLGDAADAGFLQVGGGGEGEGVEAAGFRVAGAIFKRCARMQCPNNVYSGRKNAEMKGILRANCNKHVIGQGVCGHKHEDAMLGGFHRDNKAIQARDCGSQFAARLAMYPPVFSIRCAIVGIAPD